MRAELLRHIELPKRSRSAWVKRSSLRALIDQVARTTLDVQGFAAIDRAGGTHFRGPPVYPEHPFAVSIAAGGLAILPGSVSLGIDSQGPKIGGVSLGADPAPTLDYRADGVVCVVVEIEFDRGTSALPYSTAASFSADSYIAWLEDVTPAMGVIDGSGTSAGLFAWPLAQVAGGTIHQLTTGDIEIHPRITSIF